MRQPERQYHTKFGWWLMTHDRGAAAVIGGGAGVILIADVLYAASRWGGSFSRSFLISLGGLAAVCVLAFGMRLSKPVGADRRRARWNQRGTNVVLVIVIAVFVLVGNRLGNATGEFLGLLAGLAGFFAVFTLVDVLRKRRSSAYSDDRERLAR